MTDELEVLLQFHQCQLELIVHQEGQRTSATNLIMIVTAGVTGLATFDGALNVADLPLTLLLIILGIFGAVFSLKHYERFRWHLQHAIALQVQIEKLVPNSALS
jgi:TctA family transporter